MEIGSEVHQLYMVGHVANALRRTVWSIKHWERIGLLPKPVFLLDPGDPRARRHLYPGTYIDALAEIAQHGYIGRRLDFDQWARFQREACVRGQISVPAFGHEKSPPLRVDVQVLASVDRSPF